MRNKTIVIVVEEKRKDLKIIEGKLIQFGYEKVKVPTTPMEYAIKKTSSVRIMIPNKEEKILIIKG